LGCVGIVAGNGIVGKSAKALGVAQCSQVLKGADAEMARGNAGKNGAGEGCVAEHQLAGSDCGEGARGGDA